MFNSSVNNNIKIGKQIIKYISTPIKTNMINSRYSKNEVVFPNMRTRNGAQDIKFLVSTNV